MSYGATDETWTDHNGKTWTEPQSKRLKFRSAGTYALRAFVFIRDQFTCQDCGHVPEDAPQDPRSYDGRETLGSTLTRLMVVDHVLSRRNGGRHHPSNLRTLCDPCNARKSALVDSRHGKESL